MKYPFYDRILDATKLLARVGLVPNPRVRLVVANLLASQSGEEAEKFEEALKACAGRVKDAFGFKKVKDVDPEAVLMALAYERDAETAQAEAEFQRGRRAIDEVVKEVLPGLEEAVSKGMDVDKAMSELDRRFAEVGAGVPVDIKNQILDRIHTYLLKKAATLPPAEAPAEPPPEPSAEANNESEPSAQVDNPEQAG